MNNKDKKIKLYFERWVCPRYCIFNLKGEFILYSSVRSRKIIWIYSTQTKNNKWKCKKIYKIPEDFELISISKYDKIYLYSSYCIYEWDINTEKSIRIFENKKVIKCSKIIFKTC